MNVPPVEAVRVPPAALQQFVEAILAAVGMEAEHASLLAHLLVTNDLRGVFSHGTRQVATYARDLRAGTLNPRPQIRVRDETPTTFAVDGDGGPGLLCGLARGARGRGPRQGGRAGRGGHAEPRPPTRTRWATPAG